MNLLWRRLAAGLIDIMLALVASGLIAGAIYGATGGVVRMGVLTPVKTCVSVRTLSAEAARAALEAAPGHTPTDATACTDRFLGLETNRHLVVAMAGRDARVVFVPVGPDDVVVSPMKLGWLVPMALIVLIVLAQAVGGVTPGTFALGIKAKTRA